MNAIWIVLPILTLLMFELGLTLQTEDFQLFRKRPRPIIAGLAGQIILLPILAFALGHVFHLEPLFFIGIILIACSPGMQQHYYAVHYPRDYGIRHTLCRQQSGHRYPSPRRQPHHAELGPNASSHCSRHTHEALPSANGRKDS